MEIQVTSPKFDFSIIPTPRLRDNLRLYRSLKSKGVKDEILISLMEKELTSRKSQ